MTATASINPNLTPPSSSSFPDDLFSQFAFRGSSGSRFWLPPSKSTQQNPTSQDFTQNTTILMTQHSPISTLEDFQISEPKNHLTKPSSHKIPICPSEDLQNCPNCEIPVTTSLSSEAHEPPILTLDDLHNAKADHHPPRKPSLARRVLRFYREFGFDQKMVQTTSNSDLNLGPVQQGAVVVSRYFQNSKSTQEGERIVARYFQNSEKERAAHNEDGDANFTEQTSKRPMVGGYSKRRRKYVAPSSDNPKKNQHSLGKASRSVQKSGTDKRVRIVSRYFQNSEKNLEVDREVSPSLQNSKSNQQAEQLVSRFFQKSAKQQAVNSQQEATEPLNQRAKSVRRVRKPVNERKHRDKTSSAKPRTTLSAAELFSEAYRRKSSDDTWKPPPSGIRLLQQDHAYDPWRVLVICMLLNRTTGQQFCYLTAMQ